MKPETKKIILIAVAVSIVGLFGFVLWYLGGYKTYKDPALGFSVKYPYDWKGVLAPSPGKGVGFFSPRENALDVFQESVSLTIEPVPGTLADIKNFSNQIILQMTKVFNNVKVEESKVVQFGNRKGWRILFSTDEPDKMKILTVFTIDRGETAYILTYTAQTKRYKTHLSKINWIIRTFKVLK